MKMKFSPNQKLIFSLEVRPVSLSQLQDSAEDWTTRVVNWPLSFYELLQSNGHAGCSGKTFLASCQETEDGILVSSSGKFKNSGMGSPTESWTLNTSEFHSGVAESFLSDILETGDVPQRYFLSKAACQVILRRAEKRGKKLPLQLEEALKIGGQQVERTCSEP